MQKSRRSFKLLHRERDETLFPVHKRVLLDHKTLEAKRRMAKCSFSVYIISTARVSPNVDVVLALEGQQLFKVLFGEDAALGQRDHVTGLVGLCPVAVLIAVKLLR